MRIFEGVQRPVNQIYPREVLEQLKIKALVDVSVYSSNAKQNGSSFFFL